MLHYPYLLSIVNILGLHFWQINFCSSLLMNYTIETSVLIFDFDLQTKYKEIKYIYIQAFSWILFGVFPSVGVLVRKWFYGVS